MFLFFVVVIIWLLFDTYGEGDAFVVSVTGRVAAAGVAGVAVVVVVVVVVVAAGVLADDGVEHEVALVVDSPTTLASFLTIFETLCLACVWLERSFVLRCLLLAGAYPARNYGVMTFG